MTESALGAAAGGTRPDRALLRNRRGIRSEDWSHDWPEPKAGTAGGMFFAQQRIQALVRRDPSDITAILDLPPGLDEAVWQYEQLRQVCLELNGLFVALEDECTRETCEDMRVSDWAYMCAAHTSPQPCSAIDYFCHNLDCSTALLNSSMFPSREMVPEGSMKHLHNVARRLYRVFAHACWKHKATFLEFEAATHLYERFLELSTKRYSMISETLIVVTP